MNSSSAAMPPERWQRLQSLEAVTELRAALALVPLEESNPRAHAYAALGEALLAVRDCGAAREQLQLAVHTPPIHAGDESVHLRRSESARRCFERLRRPRGQRAAP